MIDDQIDAVIGREGGYSNNPADRGGATMWGITEQVARAYGYAGDMASLRRATAVEIYRKRYWTGVGFDAVAAVVPAVAAEMFDCGVNMGPAVAGTFLQRALNVLNRQGVDYPDVVADGAVGALTIAALKAYRLRRPDAEGAAVLLWVIRALRATRYIDIAERNPTQEAFEYGWIARQVRMAA